MWVKLFGIALYKLKLPFFCVSFQILTNEKYVVFEAYVFYFIFIKPATTTDQSLLLISSTAVPQNS
jgi:hypothetical protein